MRRVSVAIWLALAACDSPGVLLCGEIPADGCPIGRGGTCDDVYCAALYDCVQGDWERVERCPNNPVTSASATSSGAGGAGEGGCAPVVIDHSTEAEGCTPDLQEPDCPAVAAETCPNPCLTGCVDFFLCEREGWKLVAFCDDALKLTIVP
ncbi:MAG: hypothetical protein JNL21_21115 [Myxococcales bacterium]|nr:hypothetical protein [Myxococcales bacterium]